MTIQSNSEKQGKICYDENQKLRWEKEGGANPSFSHTGHRSDSRSIEDASLETQVTTAKSLLDNNKIDEAVSELSAAAYRLIDHKQLVHSVMDDTIKRLTTIGCQATAPHPQALSLIRLRDKLPS